jgi:anaerobic carbon-monoxide dehydrogenase iron sulfur subunit
MNQVFVRTERCTGCRSCEIACAVRHSKGKTLFAALSENPLPKKRLFVEEAGAVKMPVTCRHCEDAPCLNACITGSLYRDEQNFVRRKKERCVGCWSCVMACPFGVVGMDMENRLSVKCDRCHSLDVPACVSACPTKALVLVDVDQYTKEQRKQVVLKAVQTS